MRGCNEVSVQTEGIKCCRCHEADKRVMHTLYAVVDSLRRVEETLHVLKESHAAMSQAMWTAKPMQPTELSLPTSTIEEFMDLEGKLVDPDLRRELTTRMNSTPAGTVSEAVRYMLDRVMNRDVLRQLNFAGANNAIPFKKTHTFSALQEVIVNRFGVTGNAVANGVCKWLQITRSNMHRRTSATSSSQESQPLDLIDLDNQSIRETRTNM
ncbi:unnamed protein product [Dicrocoelium dendriticum]|nr:unnamed protein product [Dicrocoelium dendriticum]